ncbi:MAG TPA: hypothetical protein VGN17_23285 [Bryobacteraceae bacterium]
MVAGVAVAMLAAVPLAAIMVPPPTTPVDRLIQSAQAEIQKKPDDPQGYYRLGRTHYVALALKGRIIQDFGNGRASGRGVADPPLSEEELRQHYTEAVRNLREAIRRDPGIGYFHLTLACVYEESAKLKGVAPELQAALDEFGQAFRLSEAEDAKNQSKPLFGVGTLVSYEAATSYLQLAEDRSVRPDPALATAMKDHMAHLNRLPTRVVSPIILPVGGEMRLADLLDASATTSFDLDGTGRGQKWAWVKADTGILVWDPERSGEITSGRQLFGNVTWWIFWENGYQALAALDDNRDGWLRGAETKGLAVWFDRNQNGRSDPGEVIPIEQTEIEAIAVRFDGREEDGSWRAARGVEMRDGSFRPSWDWLARPSSPKVSRRGLWSRSRPGLSVGRASGRVALAGQ